MTLSRGKKAAITAAIMLVPALFGGAGTSGKVAQRSHGNAGLRAGASGGSVPVWIFFHRDDRLGTSPPGRRPPQSRRSEERMRLRGASPAASVARILPSREQISSLNGLVLGIRHLSGYFHAVSADVMPERIDEILAVPRVSDVRRVRTFTVREPEIEAGPSRSDTRAHGPLEFGKYGGSFGQLALTGSVELLEAGYNGSGESGAGPQIMIGVLDSGYSLEHEAFSGLDVEIQYDFVGFDSVTSDEPEDYPGQDRHGTLVLGALAGYSEGDLIGPAWGARYILAKTEIVGEETRIEEDKWVAGLEWCDSIGADVVTSSLGYVDWYAPDSLDGETALCTRAADIAVSRGIVVCNAAGNYGYRGPTSIIAPADGFGVIAVGGVYADGTLWSSSSRGPTADGRIKPDLVAQAVQVHSVQYPGSGGYWTYSGTSFASPLVAGLCAQLLEIHPEWSPMTLRDSLLTFATNSESPDNSMGYGIPRGLVTSGLVGPGEERVVTFSCGYPNPFSESTAFDLYSSGWTRVSARVYDVAGRLVRELLDGEPLVLGGTLVWDGRNDEGRDLASGVYFVEFVSPHARRTVKSVRIR